MVDVPSVELNTFYATFQLLRHSEGTEHAQTVRNRLSSAHAQEPGNEATGLINYTGVVDREMATAILHERQSSICHMPW